MRVSYIPSLTPLRGIAAILVAVYHFQERIPDNELLRVTAFFANGYLWVDFFFLLSGFVIAHVYLKMFINDTSRVDYKKFIFSRFARIYPLHIFIFLIPFILELGKLFLVEVFQFGFEDEPFGEHRKFRSIIPTILLLPNMGRWNPPSWSISVEFAVYLIFPFLLAFFYMGKYIHTFFKMTLLFLGLLVFMLLNEGDLTCISWLGLIRCFFEFFLGVLTYRIYKANSLEATLGNSLFLVAVFMSIVIVMHYNFNDLLIVPCFILLILSASHGKGLISKILNSKMMTFLGDISYSIYLLHMPLMEVCQNLWELVFKTKLILSLTRTLSIMAIVENFLFLFLLIAAATLTYKWVEVPFRRSLKETQFAKKYFLN